MSRLMMCLLAGIALALATIAIGFSVTPTDALACNPKVERC